MRSFRIFVLMLWVIGSQAHGQGSLTPPAGAPAAVMKSLDQIEGRTLINTLAGDANAVHVITVPGSYCLNASVTGQSGKAGIRVEAVNVTIDLNGFVLDGVAGATKGIEVNSAGGPIVVSNGQLRSWPDHGIYAPNASQYVFKDLIISSVQKSGIWANGAGQVERVTVVGAKDFGIFVAGTSAQATIVRDCRVENIGQLTYGATGISAANGRVSGCSVANVTATLGSATGILAANGSVSSCLVRQISASSSDVAGIKSRDVADSTVVGATTTVSNNSYGIEATASVRDCSVSGVSAKAIAASIISPGCVSNSRVEYVGDSSASNYGIWARQVIDCSIDGSAAGDSRGINLIASGLAVRNTTRNTLWGIYSEGSATVTGNNITSTVSGIQANGTYGVAANNYVSATSNSGSTGITSSTSWRIESNHVTGFATGINASSATAVVVRNTAAGNTTNFSIPAGMPVVTTAAIGTNPNANISQ
jgi:hypothetical protein